MSINIVSRPWEVPSSAVNTIFLVKNNWNDHGFYTTFGLIVFDKNGKLHDIGLLRIAYTNQKKGESEHASSKLGKGFEVLDSEYFSLGASLEYYRKVSHLPKDLRDILLKSLNDMVYNKDIIDTILDEDVVKNSLLRDASLTTIKNQYVRVLKGGAPLTEFIFEFKRKNSKDFSDIDLKFEIYPESKPNTNIHVLIGRNGIGKTTILNGMIDAVIGSEEKSVSFVTENLFLGEVDIPNDYFSRMVSVSFSAFDPFRPYDEQDDPTKGTCYSYIGLKSNDKEGLKEINELHDEFIKALKLCIHLKKDRWLSAIQTLESDNNFSEMNLKDLVNYTGSEIEKIGLEKIKGMSSGHAIVLITLTRLLATVEEKTLVLIDEPESHLHPPLLSAFIRTLSDLLIHQNGVAIIATHSPVVLQEVPKSCVLKIIRSGEVTRCFRPEIETFGENVGILTRDVFGLEVTKSGFYNLLDKSVSNGGSYQSILEEYDNQLGMEGRLLLKSLVHSRDNELINEKD